MKGEPTSEQVFTLAPKGPFQAQMVLVVASVNTVSDSKCPGMVMIERLKEATSGYCKGRILILQPTPIIDSNVKPKRALSCTLEA